MRKAHFHILLSLVLACTSYAQKGKISGIYQIDTTNTQITFSARHFGVINVEGSFRHFSGEIGIENNIVHSVDITIDVESITTGNKSRDKSLKSESFLDTSSFPTIKVFSENNSDSVSIFAQVQIKNVKQFLKIRRTLSFQKREVLLEAHCTLSLKDFQLDFGTMDDLVSDEIKVSAFVTLKIR